MSPGLATSRYHRHAHASTTAAFLQTGLIPAVAVATTLPSQDFRPRSEAPAVRGHTIPAPDVPPRPSAAPCAFDSRRPISNQGEVTSIQGVGSEETRH